MSLALSETPKTGIVVTRPICNQCLYLASISEFNMALEADTIADIIQGLHRLEKYLNIKGFLEKCLKMKYALKST